MAKHSNLELLPNHFAYTYDLRLALRNIQYNTVRENSGKIKCMNVANDFWQTESRIWLKINEAPSRPSAIRAPGPILIFCSFD